MTWRWPWLTISVFVVTSLVVAVQLNWPPLVELLQWDARLVLEGQFWRMLTGLLVHTSGWSQIALNFTVLVLLGTLIENIWPRWMWVAGFAIGALTAEAFALSWYQQGGGNSVGLCGLFGLFLAGLLRSDLPDMVRIGFPVVSLAGALSFCAMSDIHGPPVLAGALFGFFALRGPVSFAAIRPALR